MITSSCLTLMTYTYLLKTPSYTVSLLYTTVIGNLHSFCYIVCTRSVYSLSTHSLSAMPINWLRQPPKNDTTSWTIDTTHTRASDTNIYIYICSYIVQTRGKAIIGIIIIISEVLFQVRNIFIIHCITKSYSLVHIIFYVTINCPIWLK